MGSRVIAMVRMRIHSSLWHFWHLIFLLLDSSFRLVSQLIRGVSRQLLFCFRLISISTVHTILIGIRRKDEIIIGNDELLLCGDLWAWRVFLVDLRDDWITSE